MRKLCNRLDKTGTESKGTDEKASIWPRCVVLSPWELSYAPHELQRDRDARNTSDRAWWTDNRHIAPDSDLMAALVQLFFAAIQG